MKQYSIKTMDGNRFDIETDEDLLMKLAAAVNIGAKLFPVHAKDCTKVFNIDNIVSITEREI